MKTNQSIYTFLAFILTTIVALGQNVTFKAEANRKSVAVGESLQVGFFIEADAMDYSIDKPMTYPQHNGFRLVGENRSQNVQYINGKGVVQDGIILVFNPEKEGKLRIGSAKIVIDGKTYTTKPIDITVTSSGTTALNNRSQADQPVFLQTNVSNKNPYVNEQVNLSVKMYSRDLGLLNRKRNFRQGKLEGLNPKMVTSRPETIKQEMVSGKPFFSEEVAKYILFPQKPGKIVIDDFTMDILISGIYGTEAYEIKSNPVVIHAKALPNEGKPANFNGAVGDFKLTTSLDKSNLKANESANLKVEISGNGNFNSVIVPEVKTPKNLETYAPKKKNAFNTYDDGMKGSVSQEMVMVPEYGGEYTIAPVEFSYFDPKKEKYVTLKSDEVSLKVDGETPNEIANENGIAFNGHNEDTSGITESVAEIAEEVTEGNGKYVWALGGLAVLGLLGFMFVRRKKGKEEEETFQTPTNNSFDTKAYQPKPIVKNQPQVTEVKITEETKKLISTKLNHLKENIHHPDYKTFYQSQEDLLCTIGMKHTNTDLANFSDYAVGEKLCNAGWDRSLVDEWKRLLNNARQAKYSAMQNSDDDLTQVFFETENLVKKINQK
ncbi:MAG TPA: BatD family protein [Faecalibacter sp.]